MSGRNNTNLDELNGSGATAFINLTDTPSTYGASSGDYVVVNGSSNGLIFQSTPPTGVTMFTQLSDVVPFSGANKTLKINATNDGIEYFSPLPIPVFFPDLSDVDAYSGANKYAVINGTNNGITYITPPVIPNLLTDLSDVAPYSGANKMVVINGTNNGIDYITQPVPPTVPTKIFQGSFTDVPLNYSVNKEVLTTNGFVATWAATKFINCSDTPGSYVGNANKICSVNVAENAIEFINATTSTSFLTLSDTPASYVGESDKFVKVKADETGLHFVAGGLAPIGLLDLNDNTGALNYSNSTVGLVAQANDTASGFALNQLLTAQQSTPRLIQNFNLFIVPAGKPTFTYNTLDAIYPLNTHLFGCYRPNYNDPGTPWLNYFWKSKQPSGGSRMYGPDNSGLDIEPADDEGVNFNHHSCGAKFTPFNNKIVPSPPSALYQNWVMDVEVHFSARIDFTNLNNKIFLLYINTPDWLQSLVNDPLLDKQSRARSCDYNFTPLTVEDTVANISVHKIITIGCWDVLLNRKPIINVYMKVINTNYDNDAFTIQNYTYINCCYKIIGCRDSGNDNTVLVPGVYW